MYFKLLIPAFIQFSLNSVTFNFSLNFSSILADKIVYRLQKYLFSCHFKLYCHLFCGLKSFFRFISVVKCCNLVHRGHYITTYGSTLTMNDYFFPTLFPMYLNIVKKIRQNKNLSFPGVWQQKEERDGKGGIFQERAEQGKQMAYLLLPVLLCEILTGTS